jgi:glycosyltransferase involved in cell wall biosynthesis
MIILSNDYPSNLPRSTKVAHGGTENFASAFSEYVEKSGHAWVGIVRQDSEVSRVTRIRAVGSRGNRCYYKAHLPGFRIGTLMTKDSRVCPENYFAEEIDAISAFVRRARPDVVFLNGYDIHAWMILRAASREGIPVVVQHAGIARIECSLYRHLYSRAGMAMMLEMERDIVKYATTEIFLNAYSRDAFASAVAPVPPRQATVIPLPFLGAFDAKRSVSSRKTVAREDRLVVGCVARWDRIKNHKALFAVAKEARRLGLPWTFRAVTRIPDTAFDRRFKDSYRRLIEVVDPMRQTELPKFYRSADLLLLPSVFDVSPTVVMEAALEGRPTLISPGVGWNSEYRACGMEDWIVDFSDPNAVVRRILALGRKRAPVRFANMIRSTHAPDVVFERYLRTLASAIAKTHPL